jgi:hypothetical protein
LKRFAGVIEETVALEEIAVLEETVALEETEGSEVIEDGIEGGEAQGMEGFMAGMAGVTVIDPD